NHVVYFAVVTKGSNKFTFFAVDEEGMQNINPVLAKLTKDELFLATDVDSQESPDDILLDISPSYNALDIEIEDLPETDLDIISKKILFVTVEGKGNEHCLFGAKHPI